MKLIYRALSGILLAILLAVPVWADVNLAWDANSEPDLAGYNVYRSTTSGSGYVKLNTALVQGTTYTDTDADVDAGTAYFYVCTAVDTSQLESGFSNEVNNYSPAAPTGLRMVQSGPNARLYWEGPPGASYYRIYRKATLAADWTQVGLTAAQQYRDKVPNKRQDYWYTVTAVLDNGTETGYGEIVQYVGK
jgi:fibronectin type 3 domain-containing protein